ncbi:MAG: hypothetical protein J5809_07930 [Selenomonadaceae bacterium]|nr:hypothetical protein [Selenomonadaceae bacterium]
MLGAAQEILELDKNSADGFAVLAEANLYLGNLDAAEKLAPDNLRGRLVKAAVAAERFELIVALKSFAEVQAEARATGNRKILSKALAWSANSLYLAGDAKTAAENLREASALTGSAELFSKHLFLSNYNGGAAKSVAQEYDKFFAGVEQFQHENHHAGKKIRVGYISPDFRQHAVANFVKPLLSDFDAENFEVSVYQNGASDFVTAKLKNDKVHWRDLNGLDAETVARIIYADGIDILVDLSGHTQNSCLPVLAYKPAPVQICAIGYTATTGLSAVDYVLSDTNCAADENNFTEKILRVEGCQLCYAPFADMPAVAHKKNSRVTFGSFNNFAKVTDEVLELWREILNAVPNSRLIVKSKICSVPDGRKIVMRRLKDLPVELRPYSRDYLEQYNDIDIALDTFPYNGGVTTCEALYMGVPVVTLRGGLGASILTAAGCQEFIAQDAGEYIKKAVGLSQRRNLNLREKVLASRLMDGKRYMRALEKIYREILDGGRE